MNPLELGQLQQDIGTGNFLLVIACAILLAAVFTIIRMIAAYRTIISRFFDSLDKRDTEAHSIQQRQIQALDTLAERFTLTNDRQAELLRNHVDFRAGLDRSYERLASLTTLTESIGKAITDTRQEIGDTQRQLLVQMDVVQKALGEMRDSLFKLIELSSKPKNVNGAGPIITVTPTEEGT